MQPTFSNVDASLVYNLRLLVGLWQKRQESVLVGRGYNGQCVDRMLMGFTHDEKEQIFRRKARQLGHDIDVARIKNCLKAKSKV
jgi:hypothetical protein